MSPSSACIGPDQVDNVFANTVIERLATESGLPEVIGIPAFSKDVREAVAAFLIQQREFGAVDVRRQMIGLLRETILAIERIENGETADIAKVSQLLKNLRPETRLFIERREKVWDGRRVCHLLPGERQLAREASPLDALERIIMMLTVGAIRTDNKELKPTREGHRLRLTALERRIGNSNDTVTYQPYAPELSVGRQSNQPAREMIMWVQVAYHRATSGSEPTSVSLPSLTSDPRKPGPLTRFIKAVFDEVGRPNISVPDAINLLNAQRRFFGGQTKNRRRREQNDCQPILPELQALK